MDVGPAGQSVGPANPGQYPAGHIGRSYLIVYPAYGSSARPALYDIDIEIDIDMAIDIQLEIEIDRYMIPTLDS